jgi:hypothetical protein
MRGLAVTPATAAPDQTPRATRQRDGPVLDLDAGNWIELTAWHRTECDRGHWLAPGRYVAVQVDGTAFRACVDCFAQRTKRRHAIYPPQPPPASPNPQL